jgi:hypothetical protein
MDEEERRFVVTVREHLRSNPSYADQHRDWIDETRGLMDGTLKRVWHPNPKFREYGEPIGYWSTERKR